MNTLKLIASICLMPFLNNSFSQCDSYVKINPVSTLPCNNNNYPWVLVFEDNFNQNDLDFSNWVIPGQGVVRDYIFENEKQWYANSGTTPAIPYSNNIVSSNGTLKLIAKKEANPILGTISWSPLTNSSPTSTFTYTSGHIESKKKFGYGAYEIRCKIPKGKGMWPAFWTYGDPYASEIDILEFWNESDCGNLHYMPSRLARNPHFTSQGTYEGNHYSCLSSQHHSCIMNWDGPDYSEDFHTFTMVWDNFKISWFIDGQCMRTTTKFINLSGQQVDCSGFTAWHTYFRDKSFPQTENQNIIVNLAVKNGDSEPDNQTIFPLQYEIDYIRYYKKTPCNSDLNISNNGQLTLSNELYNYISGAKINVGTNVSILNNQQLKLAARTEINLEPGFSSENGSDFEAIINPSMCSSNINVNTDIMDNFSNYESKMLANDHSNYLTISAYPNPTKNSVNIGGLSQDETYSFYFYDIFGNQLLNFSVSESDFSTLDLSNFTSGMYTLKILDSKLNTVYFDKLIKL